MQAIGQEVLHRIFPISRYFPFKSLTGIKISAAYFCVKSIPFHEEVIIYRCPRRFYQL